MDPIIVGTSMAPVRRAERGPFPSGPKSVPLSPKAPAMVSTDANRKKIPSIQYPQPRNAASGERTETSTGCSSPELQTLQVGWVWLSSIAVIGVGVGMPEHYPQSRKSKSPRWRTITGGWSMLEVTAGESEDRRHSFPIHSCRSSGEDSRAGWRVASRWTATARLSRERMVSGSPTMACADTKPQRTHSAYWIARGCPSSPSASVR